MDGCRCSNRSSSCPKQMRARVCKQQPQRQDEETFVSAFPRNTLAELNISLSKRIRRSFLKDILKSDL